MQYRRRPTIIDAIRARDVLRAASRDWMELPEWFRVAYSLGGIILTGSSVFLPTLEGVMEARSCDWIIRGIMGELYPCREYIFEACYEAIEP